MSIDFLAAGAPDVTKSKFEGNFVWIWVRAGCRFADLVSQVLKFAVSRGNLLLPNLTVHICRLCPGDRSEVICYSCPIALQLSYKELNFVNLEEQGGIICY